jgi:hypothetical protein
MRCLPDQNLQLRKMVLDMQKGRCAITGRHLEVEAGVLVEGLKNASPDDQYSPGLRGVARSLTGPSLIAWWLLPLMDKDWCRSLCRKGQWKMAAWPSDYAFRNWIGPDLPLEAYRAPFVARAWMGLLFAQEIRAWRYAFTPGKIQRGLPGARNPESTIIDNRMHDGWVLIPRTPLDGSWLDHPTWPPGPRGWDDWLRSQPDPSHYWNDGPLPTVPPVKLETHILRQ